MNTTDATHPTIATVALAAPQRRKLAPSPGAVAWGGLWFLAILLIAGSGALVVLSRDTYIVTSGSMMPAFGPGDAIYVRPVNPVDIRVGDIITFKAPGHEEFVTHRVFAIEANGIQTKGDFNADPDPWQIDPDQVVGKTRVIVPNVGTYLSAIRSSGAGFLVVSVPLVLLLFLQSKLVVSEWRKWRSPETHA